jgi:mRNA-degrading endonuclease toxin of MazEF toxin-antitoxin module
MRRGEIYRFEPVINRTGQSTKRLVVSADAVNDNERIPYCFAMHVVDDSPDSLLAASLGDHGWAFALETDRPLKRQLTEQLGTATLEQMEQVDNAMRAVFEL